MRKCLTLLFFVVLLASCSKTSKDFTYKDYKGDDNVSAKATVQKEYGDEGLTLIKDYEIRLNSEGKEPDYTMSLDKIIQLQQEYLVLIAPREEVYKLAVDELKRGLKHPSSAICTALSLNDSDSLTISFNKDSSCTSVRIQYHAQNSFGTYLTDKYSVSFMKDKSNKWIVDDRVFFHGSPFWGFDHNSTKSEVIRALDSTNYKYKITNENDGIEKLTINNYEIFFISDAIKVNVYFKGEKIQKYIVTLERGDEAITTYNLIKTGVTKTETIHNNIDALVFEDVYFYVGESTSRYTFFVVENKI